MYFAYVMPKRGSDYYGPTRNVAYGYRLLREACAAAEELSEDDSVKLTRVLKCDDLYALEHCVTYINGKKQKP